MEINQSQSDSSSIDGFLNNGQLMSVMAGAPEMHELGLVQPKSELLPPRATTWPTGALCFRLVVSVPGWTTTSRLNRSGRHRTTDGSLKRRPSRTLRLRVPAEGAGFPLLSMWGGGGPTMDRP